MTQAARFIQIHWLSSYPATLLNRDDAGQAKRVPFGGKTRSRVSSQCLKRHWRLAGQSDVESAKANPWALHHVGVPMGLRSKEVVEREILPRAAMQLGVEHTVIDAAMQELLKSGKSAPTDPFYSMAKAVHSVLLKGLYGDKAEDKKNRQALLFGEPEIAYLANKTREALQLTDAKAAATFLETFFKNEKKNLNTMKNGAGLESALFGRMVTSDPEANSDAAIHVAHALSVHAIERELDFMTVVDDLKSQDESADAGAAGVFDMELSSGVYYGYVVIDVPLLVSNLAGDRAVAAKVVEHLLHLIAEVTPGAKKGSTAPYSFAEFMLVEAGNRQPRTLANAFRKAVPLGEGDVAEKAVAALSAHLARMDAAYGGKEERCQLSTLDAEVDGVASADINTLATFAAAAVGKDAA